MEERGDFSPVWESIKDGVTLEFWEEFELFFEANLKHPDFIGLLR